MNFREMDAARGWVTAEGYSLHSIYLLTIALTLIAAPDLASRLGSYRLVVAGLGLLVIGAAINGLFLDAAGTIFGIGRVLAGVGSGLVIYNAPRIHQPSWKVDLQWAGIILPAAGPVVVAYANYSYGLARLAGRVSVRGHTGTVRARDDPVDCQTLRQRM